MTPPGPGRGRRHAIRLRFMAEEFADAVLWGDESESVEDELDLPDDLRRRIKTWLREYRDSISAPSPPWTAEDVLAHDRRGHNLSQELQVALGDDYFVRYHFITEQVRREPRMSADD